MLLLLNWAPYVLWLVLSAIAVASLLRNKREPSSTIAWLVVVIAIPVLGTLLFWILGPQRLERSAEKRKERLHAKVPPRNPNRPPSHTADHSGLRDNSVLKLAKQISEYEVSFDNRVSILPDPATSLAAMREAVRRAKHFIHLEYYIIASDEVTRQLTGDLVDAAKRGVKVRILYDSFGSLFLKRIFFKDLINQGAQIAGFLPLSLAPQRLNFNFRNHRKILLVDGVLAFTGGTNIGKQYLGRLSDNQWRDFLVQVEGPVCLQLSDVFAKDWLFTTKESLFLPEYFPEPSRAGDSIIQVLESGPDTPFHTLHQAIFLAINSAEKRVLLTTPYFVPDSAMMSALTVAALRGVEVHLLLPAKSDSALVQHASRSFYDTLLEAGASIYEYQPRILHSKVLIIDDRWTVIGSANMDVRSFRLNFELNLMVYGEDLSQKAAEVFHADLAQSKKVVREEFLKRPLKQQILENACRLLSPML